MLGVRRVAVIFDLAEEQWPSMDACGQAVMDSVNSHASREWEAWMVQPSMKRRFSRSCDGFGYTVDRLVNRHWDYPRVVKRLHRQADLFHVVDHSYAQLVHALPGSRTVVTCHDTDTFRCLTHPAEEERSWLFRAMAARTLAGLKKASLVSCDSAATRLALTEAGLVPAERIRVVPLPVRPDYSPQPNSAADNDVRRLLGRSNENGVDILHVGSTIPRKRIDILLEVFARLREAVPGVRLVRVGGAFTPKQESMLVRLGLAPHVTVLPKVDTSVLAAAYRRAAIVVLTPEREGFCLPVVEALASGTPVVATDLPVLREVGADAVSYCPLEDVQGWVTTITSALSERHQDNASWQKRRERGQARARMFSLEAYGRQLTDLYAELT